MRQRFLAGFLAVFTTIASQAATFTPLGDLAGGPFGSYAFGVSADGTVVVGYGTVESSSNPEAFRWSSGNGMVGLGFLPDGTSSSATAVSGDGSVVVGNGSSPAADGGFRWTNSTGVIALGFPSTARSVSADGVVIAGYSAGPSGPEAFRWTSGAGRVGLGDLAGGDFNSAAYGISADGLTIVGYGTTSMGFQATRWTSSDGMVGIGDLAGGAFWSEANAVSADGTVVAGFGHSTSGMEAFRWTQLDGMVGLDDLPGGDFASNAKALSADGSVVVGESATGFDGRADSLEAFIWTDSTGMQRLFDVLLAQGASGLTGWTLELASGISADGRTVVGFGLNPLGQTEAFVATLMPVPIPGAAWLLASALGALGWIRRMASS